MDILFGTSKATKKGRDSNESARSDDSNEPITDAEYQERKTLNLTMNERTIHTISTITGIAYSHVRAENSDCLGRLEKTGKTQLSSYTIQVEG